MTEKIKRKKEKDCPPTYQKHIQVLNSISIKYLSFFSEILNVAMFCAPGIQSWNKSWSLGADAQDVPSITYKIEYRNKCF